MAKSLFRRGDSLRGITPDLWRAVAGSWAPGDADRWRAPAGWWAVGDAVRRSFIFFLVSLLFECLMPYPPLFCLGRNPTILPCTGFLPFWYSTGRGRASAGGRCFCARSLAPLVPSLFTLFQFLFELDFVLLLCFVNFSEPARPTS